MALRISRRSFLKTTALAGGLLAGAGLARGPIVLAADARKDKLKVAVIGCGGRGQSHLGAALGEEIVALCDVDSKTLDNSRKWMTDPKTLEKHKLQSVATDKIKTYDDFRKMYDAVGKSLDAVFVATPDHNHAAAAMRAIKMGKHVYVEKPLTHDLWEARALAEAAREHKVVTQMGNQGHCGEGYRRLVEYIQAGAIGTVTETHTWCDNSICPCGGSGGRPEAKPVPAGVNWEAWIGTAPWRDYHDNLHPFKWRAWWDFGSGLLGDWACHLIDGVPWSLNLRHAASVEVLESTDGGKEMFPAWNVVRWDFPAEGSRAAVKAFWYDGKKDGKGNRPALADELEKKYNRKLGGKGSLYVGDKGIMYTGAYGGGVSFLPAERQKEIPEPAKSLPRNGESFDEFLKACKGECKSTSNFPDAAGPLTEMILLGILAMRAGPGQKVLWDGPGLKCTNVPALNQYVKRQYRKGWEV